MVIKVYEAYNMLSVIEKLKEQGLKYPVSTAYKLHKLYDELCEMETFIIDRYTQIFGTNVDFENLTDEQQEVYAAILGSDIEINNYYIPKMDEMLNNKAELSIDDVRILDETLKKQQ